MSPLGSVSPLQAGGLQHLEAMPRIALPSAPPTVAAPSHGFDQMLERLVDTVDAKQQTAKAVTRQVLLGESDQLHRSVIAMQEASVAFSLMIEVRNKLVESYQELMRMQV
ncbi:MAG: flagellar hook-basal body complex protein FliE [Verrucomicrobia bacterium]|nr:flagellar hook-basal body complex protein FliE [Verrucomicrobiota bacterium]